MDAAMSTRSDDAIRYSIVIPIFNEEAVLPVLLRRIDALMDGLDGPSEAIFVDDGSSDCSPIILRAKASSDPRCRYLGLSRNFGHQIAITAGMDAAEGDAVVIMDADLQDPPEVVEEMVRRRQEGYHVVYGVRTDREGETRFKLLTARLFYRLMQWLSDTDIPLDTGDFRLLDRRVVDAILAMPEKDRFLRGMVSWAGFSQIGVPYRRAPRFAGTTKYPFTKMLRFAIDGILSFSIKPLRLSTLLGFTSAGLAVLLMVYALVLRLFTHDWVAGWTALIVTVLFLGGAQLISLGIIGEYVGRLYGEAKRRPLYLVREHLAPDSAHRRFPRLEGSDARRPRQERRSWRERRLQRA